MAPVLRKLVLTAHLTVSAGWIGAVVAYLALGVSAVTSKEDQMVRAAWIAMEVTGWFVIVPLALAALLTRIVMAPGSRWGLFRHYWVLISLGLTVFSTVIVLLDKPTVSALAGVARAADSGRLAGLRGALLHPGVGLLVLLMNTGLNVYTQRGLTPYGWRRQQARRARLAPEMERLPIDRFAPHDRRAMSNS